MSLHIEWGSDGLWASPTSLDIGRLSTKIMIRLRSLYPCEPPNTSCVLSAYHRHSYMAVYFGIVIAVLLVYGTCWSIFVYGSIRAARIIHSKLVTTVLGTTLRWLDMTPTSRIITRCTADTQAGKPPSLTS